jgi:hypothetical protein
MKNVSSFRQARFHFFDGMRRLLTDFYLSIENGTRPPLNYGEILRVSSIRERIFQQVYSTERTIAGSWASYQASSLATKLQPPGADTGSATRNCTHWDEANR